MEIRTLTRAEEEIMRILWQLKKAFVKDILAEMPEPKPAYNTVSTIIRILEKKEVVGYTAYGKTHEYFPLISEEEYKRHEMQQLMVNYFDNSLPNLVSFFVKDNDLKTKDLDEIMKLINDHKSEE
ncbi:MULTISPECIES: BlaI/MecI/CopY family transcriptional regulator [Dyadobacter]|jgi:BlaI family penicillinase repressor|uniref:BlaI/MecI/CopY family transcriptional regulator n=1 Tax=Dyadobacter chenhuakuii TaxID=2909339 RepID=A0A9X1QE20_9BACT|nr:MULTISPECIES: BlaI/MecI/CopY family transcriptional regulator [Dyadobacter]MCE7073279.1 BlaI/MecI/CopY family transcriptional regulator [Dyadobacter sp. CY327]MCF2496191.1 BlaI/MecI/CopY family transcriptional regulator [Dyadobacter chenhuakuii]MCF2499621.1 BlaI/MecI/CopY family transcriptional regulator [Dyadobacter chenhuakuii]USJ30254.1 BlaI/MecI/CopY family transcriptional regulator [Dyadobacter chenhuakuii]